MSQLQRVAIAPSQIVQQQIHLTAEQQHYLSRVLRLRTGDRFIAMDGQGLGWLAQLQSGAQAQILEPIVAATELPIAVTLLMAMPKGSGMDEIVRQTTELGVSRIVPVISDRTLLSPSGQKLDRWRRIAQEAAEQSERQVVPEVSDPMRWAAALHAGPDSTARYLCAARGSCPPLLRCVDPSASSIVIAIGCEGGWTAAEVEAAIAAGFQAVSLGRRILRAVTAPTAALALVAGAIEKCQEPSSP